MRISRFLRLLPLLFAFVGATVQINAMVQAAPSAAPVNPDATPEARALLKEIDQISGHYTLTGQHNFPNDLSRWSDRIYDLTGKFPAIFGQDFGFSGGADKDSVEGRSSMIDEAIRQYRNGAVIALTWHAVRPTDDEPVTFRDSVQGHLTDFEWNELLTPGTDIYNRWAEQVDVIAGYLQQLQDAGVPVLFRPYHEMNGNWFWWGGRPGDHGSAALYRQLYDRFVNVHHLNNLVWVWNVNSPGGNAGAMEEYYPGARYADVVTMDIYGTFEQSYYDNMLKLAGDKPIALAEVGAMPSLDVLAKQPRWAYFMMWSGMEGVNSPEELQAMFHAPNVLNRGDVPFVARPAPVTGIGGPVTPGASMQAKALLELLNSSTASHVLSGQQNDGAMIAATEAVVRSAGKRPAIFGADLDTRPDAQATPKSVVEEAIKQSGQNTIVSLRWFAPNPAETDHSANENSKQQDPRTRLLTDFEWKEVTTPGTHLNQRWSEDVDALADTLKPLSDKGIAILWSPYPEPNGKKYWWSNRPGIHGSAVLYRMLFDRLVNQHHLTNLVWVWEAATPGFGPNATASAYGQFFPGLLYVDALELDVTRAEPRFRSDLFLRSTGVGKAIGLFIDGKPPAPSFFANESKWAWFLLAPQTSAAGSAPTNTADPISQAIATLYGDPRVVSR
jgi:mannan endo-1,4-beta-mannosidase